MRTPRLHNLRGNKAERSPHRLFVWDTETLPDHEPKREETMPRTKTEWESSNYYGRHATLLNKADRQVWLLAIFDKPGSWHLTTALTRQDMVDLVAFAQDELAK